MNRIGEVHPELHGSRILPNANVIQTNPRKPSHLSWKENRRIELIITDLKNFSTRNLLLISLVWRNGVSIVHELYSTQNAGSIANDMHSSWIEKKIIHCFFSHSWTTIQRVSFVESVTLIPYMYICHYRYQSSNNKHKIHRMIRSFRLGSVSLAIHHWTSECCGFLELAQ